MKTINPIVMIPDWGHYLAQDAEGMVFVYEHIPTIRHHSATAWSEYTGKLQELYQGIPPKDFTQTLEEL